MNWHAGKNSRTAAAISSPLRRGILMSLMMISGRNLRACSTASSPSVARCTCVTESSSHGICSFKTVRGIASSSAIRTVKLMAFISCPDLLSQ